MRRLFFVVVMLVFVLAAFPQEVIACTCVGKSVKEALSSANVLFVGKVISVEVVGKQDGFGERPIIVTFNVSWYWKGDVKRTILLHTVYNRMSCNGYAFQRGETYIVYAHEGAEKKLGTSICTRTNELSEADKDLRELGPPKTPAAK